MSGTLVPVAKNFGPGRLVVRPRPVPRPRNPSLRERTWKGPYVQDEGPRRRVAKRNGRQDRSASGSAIAGSGAVIGGAGLAGGGIPGVKSNRIWADVEQASGRRKKAGAATRAYRAGEFGYRTNAHHTFKTFGLGGERDSDTRAGHFKHGVQAGKVTSEDRIIPHLKVARRLSNLALLGGVGLTSYGVRRAKSRPVNKADGNRRLREYSGATAGAGGTLAAVSVGGARAMEHQGRRWSQRAVRDLEAAHRIVPNMGGHLVDPHPDRVKNRRVPDIGPARSNTLVQNNKGILSGKSKTQAHAAGKLRGSAVQARYFAGTYGGVAHIARKVRNPALAVTGVGVGGLALSHRKVRKALLYEKDQRTSVLRVAGTGAGLSLAAWGVPRHRFLGPALARGVKAATKHESEAALQALRLADSAAGTLRNVTARGERRLRTIQHVDQAINKVPRAIRPEVATAAGLILVGHSRPVRRERYTPVLVGGGY